MTDNARIHVRAKLERDGDGYPPFDVERMWAVPLDGGLCRLDNIPFYACGIALGDVFRVVLTEQEPYVADVVAPSGNGTVRIVAIEGGLSLDALRRIVGRYQLRTEEHLSMVAVNIPSGYSRAQELMDMLYLREAEGGLAFDIGRMPDADVR